MSDKGRTIVVTGAGKGLGAAFARAAACGGMRVVVNNRLRPGQADSAEAVCDSILAAGGEAVVDRSDVDDPDAPREIVSRTLSAFGRLDALILNAGISGEAARIERQDSDNLRRVMETNFFSAVRLTEAALPHLMRAPAGRIVFVSSAAGLHGLRGRAAYAASKGALKAFALTLAAEVRKTSLRVNIVCPYAATAMTADQGVGADPRLAADHAAPMAVYLASERCLENGEIFIAGARRYRRARTVESPGCNAPVDDPAWIADNMPSIAAMAGAREYPHAEAAFADFYADIGATAK